MNILFISVFADNNTITEVNNLSMNGSKVSVAATKYSRLISEGFEYNLAGRCTNLFLVPLGMYPDCKILFWTRLKTSHNYYIPFVNIIILKQLFITFYVFLFVSYWFIKNLNVEKKFIVFGFIYFPFLFGVLPFKFLKNCKIITFVPDVPDFEFSYSKLKFNFKSLLVPAYIFICNRIVLITDFFVFITKYMSDIYNNKPFFIIEGFTDSSHTINNPKSNFFKNSVMYAGGLFEKYGIKTLIEAFIEIEGDYELWLFGQGDMENIIENYQKIDSRIKYFGVRSNDVVLEYEKMAKLLINPRPSGSDFTRFSFPSKLLEYMLSGTPVLTTRLLSIPNEYYDKMFYIDDESVSGMKNSILRCLSIPQIELDKLGKIAQLFVNQNKNNRIQISRLIKRLNFLSIISYLSLLFYS